MTPSPTPPPSVTIIDYEMGNLRSVANAIRHVGGLPHVTQSPEDILRAEKLILPGVGAFPDAMRELEARHLIEPIRHAIASQTPFLGICLGMQLLFDTSEEFGEHPGLGIFPGRTIRFDLPSSFKVPHMGWNEVSIRQPDCPLNPPAKTLQHFYFVHSYHVVPQDPSLVWMEANYGRPFCAAVRRGNVMATQFHPEKSQQAGLQLLQQFVHVPWTRS